MSSKFYRSDNAAAYGGPPLTFKLVTLGDCNVGKSCLVRRFVDKTYDEKRMPAMTTGVDFSVANVFLNGRKVRLEMWDTAGEERKRITVSDPPASENAVSSWRIVSRSGFCAVRSVIRRTWTAPNCWPAACILTRPPGGPPPSASRGRLDRRENHSLVFFILRLLRLVRRRAFAARGCL